jgi:ABC-type phosphate/phosphonate transport system ATPase subunit
MNIDIERGRALVLTGPEGCGKSRLARQLASKHGSFVEISAYTLASPFDFGNALANEPQTLIVEDIPRDARSLQLVKSMLTSERVQCDRKGLEPKFVRSPNFIFCTNDANPFIGHDDRRFAVFQMGKATH